MVRGVALQINPSGSYLNPSEGIFVHAEIGNLPPWLATTIAATFKPQGIQLSWNASTSSFYHVEAKSPFPDNAWTNISGALGATVSTLTFVDTNAVLYNTRLYRIVRE